MSWKVWGPLLASMACFLVAGQSVWLVLLGGALFGIAGALMRDEAATRFTDAFNSVGMAEELDALIQKAQAKAEEMLK
jgi:hypothetical protein